MLIDLGRSPEAFVVHLAGHDVVLVFETGEQMLTAMDGLKFPIGAFPASTMIPWPPTSSRSQLNPCDETLKPGQRRNLVFTQQNRPERGRTRAFPFFGAPA